MALVKWVAMGLQRKLPRCVELADLESDGAIGLMDAICKFEPDRHVKFATYATRRIRGAILDGIRDRDWVPRLVRHRGEAVKEMHSLSAPIYDDGGRTLRLIDDIRADEEAAGGAQRLDFFNRICAGLTRAEQMIVILYYVEEITMKEIGRTLGLSESRVSQMHASILLRLRAAHREDDL